MPQALPVDAYPIATQDGKQIHLDMVRVLTLHSVTFNITTGTALDTAPFVQDGVFVLYATEDCIVDFVGVAVKPAAGQAALFISAGERVTCMLPPAATGFSAIGISVAGTLYIQQISAFAGLANDVTLGNQ